MNSSTEIIKYIYDLPYFEYAEVCKILNQYNKWEELAGIWMGFHYDEIKTLSEANNPAEELLAMWGQYNHTVLELFILLSKMQYPQPMVPLKPFVDSKYHFLLYSGDRNVHKLMDNGHENDKKCESKIGVQNLNKKKNIVEVPVNPHSNINLLASRPTILSTSLPVVPYSELALVTDNWKKENLLGQGGFGRVYKGLWKNTEVAVKRIQPRKPTSDENYKSQLQQSFREIKILNSLPHENILPLYAYSIGGEAPCLVYQRMRNGSLEDRLRLKEGSLPLSWRQRYDIGKGTARGLQYLHTVHKRPLIHGDIKPANILLDKHFEPKIGDFGLARETSADNSLKLSEIHGTKAYLPEEYIVGRILSTKIDTYSYGIVLFELATGLPAYDKSKCTNKSLKEYVNSFNDENIDLLKDSKAGDHYEEVFILLLSLAKWCTNELANQRPEMTFVYEKFKS